MHLAYQNKTRNLAFFFFDRLEWSLPDNDCPFIRSERKDGEVLLGERTCAIVCVLSWSCLLQIASRKKQPLTRYGKVLFFVLLLQSKKTAESAFIVCDMNDDHVWKSEHLSQQQYTLVFLWYFCCCPSHFGDGCLPLPLAVGKYLPPFCFALLCSGLRSWRSIANELQSQSGGGSHWYTRVAAIEEH